ncbi:hypothetical protein C9374_013580 [Naegleria lovaniensis]|uniref:Uncharacterized protein n=1 Tax=Naegleria lovaniensis TaxID=51637 RepID=A0AA88KVT4_NAELO|nr:uncharacterized protein C9374_013580 [Naegleria lovaniensis]KAG2392095.1 hypothetical protein C9374_013580 [Naegleria lovaniensis]
MIIARQTVASSSDDLNLSSSEAPPSSSSSNNNNDNINNNKGSSADYFKDDHVVVSSSSREEVVNGFRMNHGGEDGDHDRMDLRDDDDPLQQKSGKTSTRSCYSNGNNIYDSTSSNRSSSSPLKSNHYDRFNGDDYDDEQDINDRMSDEGNEMHQLCNHHGEFNQNKKRKNCVMDDVAQQVTLEEFCKLFVDSDLAVNNTSNSAGATFVEKMQRQQEFIKDIENTLYEFPFVESENASSSEYDDDQSSDDSFLQSEESSYGSDNVSEQEENENNNILNEEIEYHYRPVPNSSKLNIITLSSLKFLPFEHPDRLEIENILYFHRLSKSTWFSVGMNEHHTNVSSNIASSSSSSETSPGTRVL